MVVPKHWAKVCEKYKLCKFLGEGGNGSVYKAVHKKNGKEYAIKCIPEPLANYKHSKTVLREIQIMRHLSQINNGRHTVQLHDIIHTKDFSHVFLVMDYMKCDLARVFDNSK